MVHAGYGLKSFGALLAAVAVFAAACGSAGSGAATPTPSAADILAKPAASSMRDAQITIGTASAVTLSSPSPEQGAAAVVSGDGVVIVKPGPAMHLAMRFQAGDQSPASAPLTYEYIQAGGKVYSRWDGEKWVEEDVSTSEPTNLSPSGWGADKGPKLVAEQKLPQGDAWHVQMTDSTGSGETLDAWVRKSDGYPLRYEGPLTAQLRLVITFDRFNTNATVTAPAASDVKSVSKVTGKTFDVSFAPDEWKVGSQNGTWIVLDDTSDGQSYGSIGIESAASSSPTTIEKMTDNFITGLREIDPAARFCLDEQTQVIGGISGKVVGACYQTTYSDGLKHPTISSLWRALNVSGTTEYMVWVETNADYFFEYNERATDVINTIKWKLK